VVKDQKVEIDLDDYLVLISAAREGIYSDGLSSEEFLARSGYTKKYVRDVLLRLAKDSPVK